MVFFSILLFVLCKFPIYHLINSLSFFKRKAIHSNPISFHSFSVLIPCFNEEAIIDTTIKGLHRINYKYIEVIFINDGSHDLTFKRLKELLKLEEKAFQLDKPILTKSIKAYYQSSIYPNFFVIDKENGGKSDSLNAGINFSRMSTIVTLDADSILEENSLDIVNQRLQDENVIAAGGTVQILQGMDKKNKGKMTLKNKIIVRLQILEYLKGFYIYKLSLSKHNALAIISGAFGVFRKEILRSLGGYHETIGEDIDITLRLQEYGLKNNKKIIHIPEALCYTECPEKWKELFNQRVRWQKSFMDCLIRYRYLLLKRVFTNTLSFFLVIDAFIAGILISYFASFYFMFLILNYTDLLRDKHFLILSFSLIIFYHLLHSIIAILLSGSFNLKFKKEDFPLLIATLFSYIFVYRFFATFFTMFGSVAYFFNKDSWNKVTRTGRNYTIDSIQ